MGIFALSSRVDDSSSQEQGEAVKEAEAERSGRVDSGDYGNSTVHELFHRSQDLKEEEMRFQITQVFYTSSL